MLGLLAAVVVAVVTFGWSQRIARGQALASAEQTAEAIASRVVAPLVTRQVLAGDPVALARLDLAIRTRIDDGSLARVKVWDGDGRVVYSDEADLVGRQFELDPNDLALLGTTASTAELSELDRAENVLDGPVLLADEAVEIYAGFEAATGEPLIFEAYLSTKQLHAIERSLRLELLPLTVGSTAVLTLVLLPLGLRLARRVEEEEKRSAGLLRTSIAASDLERRRIAQRLHDDVIQDLAGVGYALSSVTATPRSEDAALDPAAGAVLARAVDVVRHDVQALRDLVTDIYPAQIGSGGLVPALQLLLEGAAATGLATRLAAPTDLDVPHAMAVLAHRVVREAVRNTVEHARASTVEVFVAAERGRLHLVVADDGVGLAGPPAEGHFGLRLIGDTVRDAGGVLTVAPGDVAGVRLEVDLPLTDP